ncbi:MAG TPA: Na+/H+ antiporter NhaC [Synergistaceae bacterium]|jgi:NhaC family Na+:H+ antiporter|nr:Na+/H+ antiporter NhaC [Synergistaceae bacterium]
MEKEHRDPAPQGEFPEGRAPTLAEALFILILAGGLILAAVQIWETDVHIPLALSAIAAAALAMFRLKVRWKHIEEAVLRSITMGMQAVLILYVVGLLIGVWILSGVVPSMISYGLNVLTPSMFLIATLLICSIVSLATGTSWGTTGTVGIALMGIGSGLGIPPAMSAGFAISGAYFGDKMSPLSDTTNLAPAMAGAELFQHIRAMCWTTLPPYAVVVIAGGLLGMKYSTGSLDTDQIQALQLLMGKEFTISVASFIAPLVVIGLAASKRPAIPSIVAGVLVGGVLALLQGASFGTLMDVMQNGYTPDLVGKIVEAGADMGTVGELLKGAGFEAMRPEVASTAAATLQELLTKGGLQSMNWTVSLILCALTFGGILDHCGYLEVLLAVLLKGVKTVGGLVTSVIVACVVTNIFAGDQYVAIVLPGRMFKSRFDQWGLHPRMLSRTLEDSGTLTSPLVPWNTCGAFQSKALGIPTTEYLPYAMLNYLTPLFAILLTYLKIGIAWRNDDAPEGFVLSAEKPGQS